MGSKSTRRQSDSAPETRMRKARVDALQWLVVVLLESGEHAQACAFLSPCHHLAPDDRWGNSLARYSDWPKTTVSLHQKLPSFLPLGVLDPQEHQAGTGLEAEMKNRPAPGRPACECSALSPLHPILISALHPPCPRAQHPLWALPPSRKPSSTPEFTEPRTAAGRRGQGCGGQWLLYSIQPKCSQTRLGVQLKGGCNHHGSARPQTDAQRQRGSPGQEEGHVSPVYLLPLRVGPLRTPKT